MNPRARLWLDWTGRPEFTYGHYFMIWIQCRWDEFFVEHGRPANDYITEADHPAFDNWLTRWVASHPKGKDGDKGYPGADVH